MKQFLKKVLIVLLFIKTGTLNAQTKDSTRHSVSYKNFLEVEVLGNEYISPFGSVNKFIPVSLIYQRMIIGPSTCWQFSVGLSAFRSRYVVQQHPTVYATPWAISTPVGFLMRLSYKRNGFWFGAFFSPAFGRQEYLLLGNGQYYQGLKFDYQVEPNLCYQFQSKKNGFVCKLSYTPKLFSNVFKKDNKDYEWGVLPLWFGLSIGGAW